MTSIELRQKRANLWEQAKALHARPEAEKREWGAEDETQWTALMGEIDKLGRQIERQEQIEAAERTALAQRTAEQPDERSEQAPDERRAAWRGFLRNGREGLTREEQRALSVGTDTAGGFLVAPQYFVRNMIQAVDNQVFIRQWATRFMNETADSLGAPSLDTDVADPTWTSELLIGSEDSSLAFGRRELKPNPLAKYIKLSNKLIRQMADIETLVQTRLAYKNAVAQENNFLNGDGVGRPLGVMVASNMGISTSRDVSTDMAATEMTADGLINVKYTLKAAYWPKAKWLFHRDGIKQIAKLKDGGGVYIWSPGLTVGEPDRLLGFPYYASEYMPNTFTTGLYVGILGDFSYYWIADALDMQLQRLVELFAATNQVAYISRLECDGMPVLAEAFVRVKLA